MPDSNRRAEASIRPAPGRDDPKLDPFEIEFRPEFRDDRGPREPFINSFGAGRVPEPGSFSHPTHRTMDLSKIADNPLELEDDYESFYPVPEVLDEP
ncbi:hypothetical protein [Cohnella fermenti]|uniref:hypothetical protein n=1 Tax=Cohnella fermenti TaxID=2565925 RepID=UPI001E417EFC|nr:hypothetical protein [Cohnella fermenti]